MPSRRVPVPLQASLEAVTVEVVAAAIARPTRWWERCCRAVFLGALGQVRVFERRGGFNRRRIGISRTTTICIDYGVLKRASKHRGTRLIVSNWLYTTAVLSEQIRENCIDVFALEEKVDQGYGERHEEQVASTVV